MHTSIAIDAAEITFTGAITADHDNGRRSYGWSDPGNSKVWVVANDPAELADMAKALQRLADRWADQQYAADVPVAS
jgi:hypothetical protein